jgi:ribose transport system substrate-binding protein
VARGLRRYAVVMGPGSLRGERWRRVLASGWAAFAVAVGAFGLAVTACGGDDEDGSGTPTAAEGERPEGGTIAISFPNATRQAAVSRELVFARAKAKELGYELILDDPVNDLNKQVSTIKTWIQQDVDAIVAVALDPKVLTTVAKDAQDAGIRWITYGVPLESQDAVIDFQLKLGGEKLGELAGDWISENRDTLGGRAKVALLTFEEGAWARERKAGILDGLTSKAGDSFQVVAQQDALSETEGLEAVSTMLQAHPDLNIVLAVAESASVGGYRAFINKGHKKDDPKVFVGGIDGTAESLDLLARGDTMYRGSAAISLKEVGEAFVEVPDGLLRGSGGDYKVEYFPLTPGDPKASEFLKEWGR